jgi:hypothetical protein
LFGILGLLPLLGLFWPGCGTLGLLWAGFCGAVDGALGVMEAGGAPLHTATNPAITVVRKSFVFMFFN